MRVELIVDGQPLTITTSDPELLGRWLAEVFTSTEWQLGTYAEVRVMPVWGRSGAELPGVLPAPPGHLPARPDWITDARVTAWPVKVRSPREFAEALLDQVHRAEQLAEADAAQAAAEVSPP